ncbi:hypothetical protein F0562_029209 [Nyssa sinensis]|uniref:Uncharacterized protein n=1 Tax=Nyssa sinensis TaxID=561372 RepID=A0A5J5B6D7_9ASTE|nr:hypothetical protein F0562_029209 [Nyssa sinensis]
MVLVAKTTSSLARISLIMKRTIIVILIVGSALLCLQANGRRFVLEEVKEKERADAEPGQKLDGVNNGATNDDDNNNKKNDGEDEKNDSYGNYDGPTGSSTDTHHVYQGDGRPPH